MKIARVVLACAALAAAPAFAQKECSKADSAAAEKAVDRVVNPSGLYKAFKDYGHCDKPPVEDVFTDAILRLLVEWKDADTVATDAQRDAGYKQFLHKHLKSPVVGKEDREAIFSRAKSNCPMTQGPFCAEVMEVVKGGSAKEDLLAPLPTIPPSAPKK
jgi:hypothetical protein